MVMDCDCSKFLIGVGIICFLGILEIVIVWFLLNFFFVVNGFYLLVGYWMYCFCLIKDVI